MATLSLVTRGPGTRSPWPCTHWSPDLLPQVTKEVMTSGQWSQQRTCEGWHTVPWDQAPHWWPLEAESAGAATATLLIMPGHHHQADIWAGALADMDMERIK